MKSKKGWRPLNEEEMEWYQEEQRRSNAVGILIFLVLYGLIGVCFFKIMQIKAIDSNVKLSYDTPTLIYLAFGIVLLLLWVWYLNSGNTTPQIIYGKCLDKQVKEKYNILSHYNSVYYYVKLEINGMILSKYISTSKDDFEMMSLNSSVAVISNGKSLTAYSRTD